MVFEIKFVRSTKTKITAYHQKVVVKTASGMACNPITGYHHGRLTETIGGCPLIRYKILPAGPPPVGIWEHPIIIH